MSNAQTEYRYNRLTWPEMNDAIAAQKLVILPTASTEQHGQHLPLDVDTFLCESVCLEVGRRAADQVLVLPPIAYGLNLHHIDFPGTIHIEPDDVHRLLPEHHQERRLSRLPEDPDRQRPRLEHAADRPGGPQDGARNPIALLCDHATARSC